MKKLLYIMGVEWNWIFQRPQVLALELEKEYELTVACPKQPIHAKHQNNPQPQRLLSLFQIPFQEKNKLIGSVAWKLHKNVLGDLSRYDIIWVGYPLFGRYIPKDYTGTIVYDCMDNFEALYPDRREKSLNIVRREEVRLLRKADIVFASSLKLKEKLVSICPDKKVTLIRNGHNNITISDPEDSKKKDKYSLGYIGTISQWFDNDAVEHSLIKIPDIYYDLIGPIDNHQIIRNERVTYSGVVEHSQLGNHVKKLDCLIMPFRINDIVLYVDPVKLYEYIAWGKCIIASWYPEIDRFQDFVYFYHDTEEYHELVQKLKEEGFPAKYTRDMQRRFLKDNTWDARVRLIKQYL